MLFRNLKLNLTGWSIIEFGTEPLRMKLSYRDDVTLDLHSDGQYELHSKALYKFPHTSSKHCKIERVMQQVVDYFKPIPFLKDVYKHLKKEGKVSNESIFHSKVPFNIMGMYTDYFQDIVKAINENKMEIEMEIPNQEFIDYLNSVGFHAYRDEDEDGAILVVRWFKDCRNF